MSPVSLSLIHLMLIFQAFQMMITTANSRSTYKHLLLRKITGVNPNDLIITEDTT